MQQEASQATEIQSDSDIYHRTNKIHVKWIKNKDNHFLIVGEEDKLIFEALSNQQLRSHADCEFTINNCRGVSAVRGVPIMLYVRQDDSTFKVLCCEQRKVSVEILGRLPDQIEDDGHRFLFFLKDTGCKNTYMIEPSVHSSHLLGFDRCDSDRSLLRLVVLSQKKEVQEQSHFSMQDCRI